MKILITGATGFIGKNLIKRLLSEKHDLWAIIRPSSKLEQIDKKVKTYIFNDNVEDLIIFFNQEKFDGVIHLASLFLGQHTSKDIRGLIDSNILFATTILEVSVKTNTRWFINTGTFFQNYKNKKYSPVNLYSATKQAFEDIAKYYLDTTNINFVTIKLCDTFGPDDSRPKIFNLWSKISRTGEKFDMSPGKQIIDINFVENVIDGYMEMISLLSKDNKRKMNGQVFLIKSNQRMSLRKLALTFEKTLKCKLNINWGGREYRTREVMSPWKGDKSIPGWKPKITIEDGIRKTFTK